MNEKVRNVKVGIFAGLAILLLLAVVMFLGKSRALFAERATLHAYFQNASGLVVGSPVRLAGIDIGTVSSIGLANDDSKRVAIGLGIDAGYLDRIRGDSIAQMTTKGLLGDMVINISLGTSGAQPLGDGDTIPSREALGLGQMMGSVGTVVQRVEGLTNTLDERVRGILTEELGRDINKIASATATIADQVVHGDGLAHAIFYDPSLTQSVKDTLAHTRKLTLRLESTATHVDRLLAEVENGDGLVHGVIYGKDGTKTLSELAHASQELATLLREVREGQGLVHTLIYEEDQTNLVRDLADAAALIKKMTGEVDEGKGTIGGLLKDPTVYRDLKHVLGEVRRNVLLKALVRMTIKNDALEAPTIADSQAAPEEDGARAGR